MAGPGCINSWLEGLRAGDEVAAQRLWEEYFRRLVGLAHNRLARGPAGPAGSEDVALSALKSFCLGAEAGRFPQLNDRNDLWQVLMMLTVRKTIDAIDRERAERRGGMAGAARVDGLSFERIVGDEPTPSFAAEVAEQIRFLLDLLADPDQRQIALWKMEGFTNREIAGKLVKSIATVERKLDLIRRKWESAGATG